MLSAHAKALANSQIPFLDFRILPRKWQTRGTNVGKLFVLPDAFVASSVVLPCPPLLYIRSPLLKVILGSGAVLMPPPPPRESRTG